MARTMMEIPFAGERQTVETAVRGVLVADKYKEIDYNGETVWKMGTGLATAMPGRRCGCMDGCRSAWGPQAARNAT